MKSTKKKRNINKKFGKCLNCRKEFELHQIEIEITEMKVNSVGGLCTICHHEMESIKTLNKKDE